MFLLKMELAWWEATVLAVLFAVPFFNAQAALVVTWIYFAWIGIECVRMLWGGRRAEAFPLFAHVWRAHVRRPA
jgi:hypothetical protein